MFKRFDPTIEKEALLRFQGNILQRPCELLLKLLSQVLLKLVELFVINHWPSSSYKILFGAFDSWRNESLSFDFKCIFKNCSKCRIDFRERGRRISWEFLGAPSHPFSDVTLCDFGNRL